MTIDSILIGEHALGYTLAYYDDGVAAAPVGIVEIASCDQRDAEGGKKSGRDHTDPRTWVIFTWRTDMAIGRERESKTETADIAPWDGGADGDGVHAWQRRDAPNGFLVETGDLIGFLSIRHYWHINREYVVGVESSGRGLEGEQRLQQHAGAGQQYKRRGDLCDGEDSQTPIRTAGDSQVTAGETESMGGAG
jgi:hypothetical protein